MSEPVYRSDWVSDLGILAAALNNWADDGYRFHSVTYDQTRGTYRVILEKVGAFDD